jgi:hypothetical protein
MFDFFAIEDTYKIKKAIYIIGTNLHTHATMNEKDKIELQELLDYFKKSIDFWEKTELPEGDK